MSGSDGDIAVTLIAMERDGHWDNTINIAFYGVLFHGSSLFDGGSFLFFYC